MPAWRVLAYTWGTLKRSRSSVTPGKGTGSSVVGPSVSTPSFSDLKSVKRSFDVTWSKSGVRALYISACTAAFGLGAPYWPDGRMLRAMMVGSLGAFATAFAHANSTISIAPMAIPTRRIPPLSSLLLRAHSLTAQAGTLQTAQPASRVGKGPIHCADARPAPAGRDAHRLGAAGGGDGGVGGAAARPGLQAHLPARRLGVPPPVRAS